MQLDAKIAGSHAYATAMRIANAAYAASTTTGASLMIVAGVKPFSSEAE